MSQWTHVNGCLRIDGIPGDDRVNEDNLRKILGHTCTFYSSVEEWEQCSVPMGSEASVQYNLIRAGNGLVLWTVPIWGDLRDFGAEEIPKIEDWFEKITKESGLSFRSAVLEIDIEYGKTIILRYSDEAEIVEKYETNQKGVEARDKRSNI